MQTYLLIGMHDGLGLITQYDTSLRELEQGLRLRARFR
jgi:hypothetical protein